jgi:streptogramin lyase
MSRTRLLPFAAAAAVVPLVAGLLAAPASAAPRFTPRPVADALGMPLSLAVADSGHVYVAQSSKGRITRITPDGERRRVFEAARPEITEVVGVAWHEDGLTFATTNYRTEVGHVWHKVPGEDARRIANTTQYEQDENPDHVNRYGFRDVSKRCKQRLPRGLNYRGTPFSHPYATTFDGTTTYLADAGANTILSIAEDGTISTVAVLPPVDVRVSRKVARRYDLPLCVAGHDVSLEAVPTDVEMGSDGLLYVTSLPGGPEDPDLGANGAVVTVDPVTGDLAQVATGLFTATGLALTDSGDILVAQLFANSIARIPAGTSDVEVWREVNTPAAVEWTPQATYATTRVFGRGVLQRWVNPPVAP